MVKYCCQGLLLLHCSPCLSMSLFLKHSKPPTLNTGNLAPRHPSPFGGGESAHSREHEWAGPGGRVIRGSQRLLLVGAPLRVRDRRPTSGHEKTGRQLLNASYLPILQSRVHESSLRYICCEPCINYLLALSK